MYLNTLWAILLIWINVNPSMDKYYSMLVAILPRYNQYQVP